MTPGDWNAQTVSVGFRRVSVTHRVPQDQVGVLGSAAVPASTLCVDSVDPDARNVTRRVDARPAGVLGGGGRFGDTSFLVRCLSLAI